VSSSSAGPAEAPRNVLVERAEGTRVVRPFRGPRRVSYQGNVLA
jgi:hypothetical protein